MRIDLDNLKLGAGQTVYGRAFRRMWNDLIAIVETVGDLRSDTLLIRSIPGQGTTIDLLPPSQVKRRRRARITGVGASSGQWKGEEVVYDDSASGYAALTDGLTWDTSDGSDGVQDDLIEAVKLPSVIEGAVVWAEMVVGDDGEVHWEIQAPVYHQAFPVALSSPSSDPGNATTQCAYTYTVQDLDGNELGTTVNPTSSPHTYNRPALGAMVAADAGLAYYENNSGTPRLVISWVNEVEDVEACVEEA